MMLKSSRMKSIARESLIGNYGVVIGAYILTELIIAACGFLTLFIAVLAFTDENSEMLATITGGTGKGIIHSIRQSVPATVLCVVLFFTFLFLTVVIGMWLGFGRRKMILEVTRGQETKVSSVFYCFGGSTHPWRIVAVRLLTGVFSLSGMIFPLLVTCASFLCGKSAELQRAGSLWHLVLVISCILAFVCIFYIALAFNFADVLILDEPETGVGAALGGSFRLMKGKKLKYLWTAVISFFFWYAAMEIAPIASLWVGPYNEAVSMVFYQCARGEIQENRYFLRLFTTLPEIPEEPEHLALPAEDDPWEVSEQPEEVSVQPAEEAIPAEAEIVQPAEEAIPEETVIEQPVSESVPEEGENNEMPVL